MYVTVLKGTEKNVLNESSDLQTKWNWQCSVNNHKQKNTRELRRQSKDNVPPVTERGFYNACGDTHIALLPLAL
jgi:hypothetical protein